MSAYYLGAFMAGFAAASFRSVVSSALGLQ